MRVTKMFFSSNDENSSGAHLDPIFDETQVRSPSHVAASHASASLCRMLSHALS
jgi:hypothetical protein